MYCVFNKPWGHTHTAFILLGFDQMLNICLIPLFLMFEQGCSLLLTSLKRNDWGDIKQKGQKAQSVLCPSLRLSSASGLNYMMATISGRSLHPPLGCSGVWSITRGFPRPPLKGMDRIKHKQSEIYWRYLAFHLRRIDRYLGENNEQISPWSCWSSENNQSIITVHISSQQHPHPSVSVAWKCFFFFLLQLSFHKSMLNRGGMTA